MDIIKGISVNKKIAMGKIFVWQNKPSYNVENNLTPEENWQLFLDAKISSDHQLEVLFNKTKAELGEEQAMIIDVQRIMLEDGDFNETVEEKIRSDQKSASIAVTEAGQQFQDFFASLEDEYMKARAIDIGDVTKRVLKNLAGESTELTFPEPVIIVAEDLTPSETLQMDREKILGFVTVKGSLNSHTAILAGVLNVPSLIQTAVSLDDSLNGKLGILDGENNLFYIDPGEDTAQALALRKKELDSDEEKLLLLRDSPTVTLDGKKIDLFANIGNLSDLKAVVDNGAEGIGLFRSEFLFLEASDYPSEETQFAAYKKVAETLDGKNVIIRTLDIGADKQIDYFGLEKEENPALGLRAIRICLQRPELFKTQLRAIYRASAYGNVSIMFPMIASVWEIKKCKEYIAEILKELASENIPVGKVEVGAMIETPAAAICADDIAKEVEFLSVGTNDLTQYTLAIDRQSGTLGEFYDPHHPAVMALLSNIAGAATRAGIWAGICGELAADTTVSKRLINMGYTEFSVASSHILPVRKFIRGISTLEENN